MLSTSMSSPRWKCLWLGRISGMFWTFINIPLNSWSNSAVAVSVGEAELEIVEPSSCCSPLPFGCFIMATGWWLWWSLWTSARVSTILGIFLSCCCCCCCTGLGVDGESKTTAEDSVEWPECGGDADVLPADALPPKSPRWWWCPPPPPPPPPPLLPPALRTTPADEIPESVEATWRLLRKPCPLTPPTDGANLWWWWWW